MNKKMIVYILGKMLGTEGLLLLIPAVVSLLYKEKTGVYFLVVAAVLFALYLGLGRKKPENKQIYGKEGFVIVGLAWILWSLFGALPFFLRIVFRIILMRFLKRFPVYDDRIYYFAEYRGSSERNEFLAVLYTLDRRNGSARFCDDDHFS